MQRLTRLLPLLFLVLAACVAFQNGPPSPATASSGVVPGTGDSKSAYIKHVVIIFQENRTPDDLFQGLASEGADVRDWGLNAKDKRQKLVETSLATLYDLGHSHLDFVRDYDCGKLDGFAQGDQFKYRLHPYSYAPLSEVQPYVDMAKQYAFADHLFETQQAGSFPAHQYIVSASAEAQPKSTFFISSNPFSKKSGRGAPAGCDAPPIAAVDTIDPANGSAGPTPFPCFNRPALSDLLDFKGVSWRYYQNGLGPGLWHAFDAIKHVRYGPDNAYVVTPPETVLSDVQSGTLPGMSWVMPADSKHSDHPGNDSAEGPSWVAAVVNAIGNSQYWNSTAIFISWDDWGGLYDHVVPPMENNYYELGFRVPLVIVSPYARHGYVSHVRHEFGSIIAFSEEAFGIPKGALHATDVRADDLSDAFDFKQTPKPFVTISAPPFVPEQDPPAIRNAEDPDPNDGVYANTQSCMTGHRGR
jgi:phospholipase C